LGSNEELLRRAHEDRGLTRPELAVLLSHSKMALQAALEAGKITEDPTLTPELCNAFPRQMQERHGDAILQHRLRREIIATKVANRFVNRLGIIAPFALIEEEGASLGQAAAAFVASERLFGMRELWQELDTLDVPEQARLELMEYAAKGLQFHIADFLRSTPATIKIEEMVQAVGPGLEQLDAALGGLLRDEALAQSAALRARLTALGSPESVAARIVRLFDLDGAIGIATLGQKLGADVVVLTRAYTKLGEALGLDWAQAAANRFAARDQWERLLAAGLARDFEQLRLDFLARRRGDDPKASVDRWVVAQGPRIDQFRRMVDRARAASVTTAPMLAQIATQARVLLAR
ncbi:MAG: NAD-glutamate dehydrogenase, partial [Pseudomonadota bacterium]|nr:NAD-glutamate dehydrogenase [Pseudomonadota bacterium]